MMQTIGHALPGHILPSSAQNSAAKNPAAAVRFQGNEAPPPITKSQKEQMLANLQAQKRWPALLRQNLFALVFIGLFGIGGMMGAKAAQEKLSHVGTREFQAVCEERLAGTVSTLNTLGAGDKVKTPQFLNLCEESLVNDLNASSANQRMGGFFAVMSALLTGLGIRRVNQTIEAVEKRPTSD